MSCTDEIIGKHKVHRQRTSRQCQRSSVSGVTSRFIRSGLGSRQAKTASTGPVGPVQLRLRVLAPQHRDLLAQH